MDAGEEVMVVKVPGMGDEIRLVLAPNVGDEVLLLKGELKVLVNRLASLSCCNTGED